jgi:hypothetical protein
MGTISVPEVRRPTNRMQLFAGVFVLVVCDATDHIDELERIG